MAGRTEARYPTRSRRSILAGAAALGAAAVAANTAVRGRLEAEGENVQVGGLYYTALSSTEISGSFNGHVLGIANDSKEPRRRVAIVGSLGGVFPDLSPAAIWGHSTHPSGDGVVGISTAAGKNGVYGRNAGDGTGVWGQSSGNGDGVVGITDSNEKAGVFANARKGGVGVRAHSHGGRALEAINFEEGVAVEVVGHGGREALQTRNEGSGAALNATANGAGNGVIG